MQMFIPEELSLWEQESHEGEMKPGCDGELVLHVKGECYQSSGQEMQNHINRDGGVVLYKSRGLKKKENLLTEKVVKMRIKIK